LSECEALKAKWIATKGVGAAASDIAAFKPAQVIGFLDILQDQAEPCKAVIADPAVLNALDAAYSFSESGNAEVKFRWCTLCIRAEMPEVLDFAVAFLLSAGRMKFVRPLFRDLYKSKVGKQLALDTFSAHGARFQTEFSLKDAI
jgi:leukotriene-A4 hydrolase